MFWFISHCFCSYSIEPKFVNEGEPGHELCVWFIPQKEAEISIKYNYTYYQRCFHHNGLKQAISISEVISEDDRKRWIEEIHGTEVNRYNYHDSAFVEVGNVLYNRN